MNTYGSNVPKWSNEEFTLYISHIFKHVPAKMVFSVFRDMGIGMIARGDDAITFREFKDRKSAKIKFKFLFTRGGGGEDNIKILEHLRTGGKDAHIQVTYQKARTPEEVARHRKCAIVDLPDKTRREGEPDRFWKVSIWRERNATTDHTDQAIGPAIALSGGKFGKEKKVVQRKIKMITHPSESSGAHKACTRTNAPVLPPLDLTGLDGPVQREGSVSPCSLEYSASSPPYHPTSPSSVPGSPDYSPPKLPGAKKSVSFSNEDDVCENSQDFPSPRSPLAEHQERLDMPEHNQKIVFVQKNNRREGTAVWTRYENYKLSTTINEARTLGATSADIKKDYEKGWFSIAGV